MLCTPPLTDSALWVEVIPAVVRSVLLRNSHAAAVDGTSPVVPLGMLRPITAAAEDMPRGHAVAAEAIDAPRVTLACWPLCNSFVLRARLNACIQQ